MEVIRVNVEKVEQEDGRDGENCLIGILSEVHQKEQEGWNAGTLVRKMSGCARDRNPNLEIAISTSRPDVIDMRTR